MVSDCFDAGIEVKAQPARKTRFHLEEWREITSDPIVLSKVSGCTIDFQEVPQQQFEPKPLIFNAKETEMISVQISRFLKH